MTLSWLASVHLDASSMIAAQLLLWDCLIGSRVCQVDLKISAQVDHIVQYHRKAATNMNAVLKLLHASTAPVDAKLVMSLESIIDWAKRANSNLASVQQHVLCAGLHGVVRAFGKKTKELPRCLHFFDDGFLNEGPCRKLLKHPTRAELAEETTVLHSAKWVALPPGAAQASRIRSPG